MNDNTKFDRRKAMIAMIESTEHPLAPQIVERAYGAVQELGKMLAGPKVDKDKLEEYANRLMGHWPADEINKVSHDPAFIMALCGMLTESLTIYTRKLAGDPSLRD